MDRDTQPRAFVPKNTEHCKFEFQNSADQMRFVAEPEADTIIVAVGGVYVHLLWPAQAEQAAQIAEIAGTAFRWGQASKSQEIIDCLNLDDRIDDRIRFATEN